MLILVVSCLVRCCDQVLLICRFGLLLLSLVTSSLVIVFYNIAWKLFLSKKKIRSTAYICCCCVIKQSQHHNYLSLLPLLTKTK